MIASNGLYFASPEQNIWDINLPNNWALRQPDYPSTHQGQAPYSEYADWRSNNLTAAIPRQPTMPKHVICSGDLKPSGGPFPGGGNDWNAYDRPEGHSGVSADGGPIARRAWFDVQCGWVDDEIEDTSTTLDEAEFLLERTLRRPEGSRRQIDSLLESSGGTQSYYTIDTLPPHFDCCANARARAWKKVLIALGRHQDKATRPATIRRGF
ncbi:uncharacterized protein C8Q71DRAFT_753503 [Rhodofomes roseus]|uniref:Uncharacterized protein n=1 Tax=Rhodofomes roseus TaxID=34475 RepID=A0ABQ8KIH1_9APHY|nr:uncharacterized protein C8Q71DRAFT_753503 [Rhodofomes roseus]KAH9837597.1 hypothetical protein C8Q71DRAFT_753503 [Rhodofomes roseus]